MPLLRQLRIKELKRELADRELITTGIKARLQNRLRDALIAEGEANPDEVEFEAEVDDVSTVLLKQMQQMQAQMQAQMQRNYEDLCEIFEGSEKGKFAGKIIGDIVQSAIDDETPSKVGHTELEEKITEEADVFDGELMLKQEVSSMDHDPVKVELQNLDQQISAMEISREAPEEELPEVETTTMALQKELLVQRNMEEQYFIDPPEQVMDGDCVNPCENGLDLLLKRQCGMSLRREVIRCGTTEIYVSMSLADDVVQCVCEEIPAGTNQNVVESGSQAVGDFQVQRIMVLSTQLESDTETVEKKKEVPSQGVDESVLTNIGAMSLEDTGSTPELAVEGWMERLVSWSPRDLSWEECHGHVIDRVIDLGQSRSPADGNKHTCLDRCTRSRSWVINDLIGSTGNEVRQKRGRQRRRWTFAVERNYKKRRRQQSVVEVASSVLLEKLPRQVTLELGTWTLGSWSIRIGLD